MNGLKLSDAQMREAIIYHNKMTYRQLQHHRTGSSLNRSRFLDKPSPYDKPLYPSVSTASSHLAAPHKNSYTNMLPYNYSNELPSRKRSVMGVLDNHHNNHLSNYQYTESPLTKDKETDFPLRNAPRGCSSKPSNELIQNIDRIQSKIKSVLNKPS